MGSVSQSLVQWLMSGRPACDDPNASRMRSVGELASVQAIPRVFQSVLSLVDITDLTLSCEASPGNGCLAGVWCCMARLRTKWSRGSLSREGLGGQPRLVSDSCYRCVYTGSPLLLPYYAGGIHGPGSPRGSSRSVPYSCYRCVQWLIGSPRFALLCGGIHSPASSMVAGFYWLQLQVA